MLPSTGRAASRVVSLVITIATSAVGCGARTGLDETQERRCAGAPLGPTQLAAEELTAFADNGTLDPASMAATDAGVYWGTTATDDSTNPPTERGVIHRYSAANPDEVFSGPAGGDTFYVLGSIRTDGGYVYFPRAGTPGSLAAPNVMAQPVRGGDAIALPNPPHDGGVVLDLAVGEATGVYWLLGDFASSSLTELVHWDGATSTTIASLPFYADELAIGHESAIVVGTTDPIGGTDKKLYSVSLSGGAAVPLRGMDGRIIGLSAGALIFYEAGILWRLDLASGRASIVVDGPLVQLQKDNRLLAYTDDTWIYYGELGTLKRVQANGGLPEVLWDDPMRGVGAVTSDGCAVHWLVSERGKRRVTLMSRSKD